jgi:murein tripeptide amidase MpaA
VIGHSRQGRAIKAVHTGNPAGPRVLIVGCIHGNECAARALITPLVAARLDADLWIIPTLNPDGMRRGTRQNAAGVDLNRNWKRWWVRSGRPWSTFYSGPSAFSEPETRVGRVFIGKIRAPWGWAFAPTTPFAVRQADGSGACLQMRRHLWWNYRPVR